VREISIAHARRGSFASLAFFGRAEIAANPILPTPLRAPTPIERAAVPRDTVALARFLLGKVLVREQGSRIMTGRIVETEAYLVGDPACHAFRGMTPRNRSLFLDAGHAYVYLCYGTAWMLNVSGEAPDVGAGVLLRALEPLAGLAHMRRGRNAVRVEDLARGPGRLAAAFGIDRRLDGVDLFGGGKLWIGSDGTQVDTVGESVRIGLTKGAEARLRFYVAGSRHLSGPRKLNA
jgi:DNA-3-methyladenine glycosylase